MKKASLMKGLREHKTAALIGAFIVLGIVLTVAAASFGRSVGTGMGDTLGKISGMAAGSLMGFQDGYEGYQEGKEDGLSAEDTLVEMKSDLQTLGKLETLVAGVNLVNHNQIGEDYQALYSIPGTAVFSVDMAQMEVSGTVATGLQVLLPQPEMAFYRNEEKLEKLSEYQKHSWTGGAEEGYQAYLNSQKELTDKAEEFIRNYDSMVQMARDSAIRQVTMLAKSVTPAGTEIQVGFAE